MPRKSVSPQHKSLAFSSHSAFTFELISNDSKSLNSICCGHDLVTFFRKKDFEEFAYAQFIIYD